MLQRLLTARQTARDQRAAIAASNNGINPSGIGTATLGHGRLMVASSSINPPAASVATASLIPTRTIDKPATAAVATLPVLLSPDDASLDDTPPSQLERRSGGTIGDHHITHPSVSPAYIFVDDGISHLQHHQQQPQPDDTHVPTSSNDELVSLPSVTSTSTSSPSPSPSVATARRTVVASPPSPPASDTKIAVNTSWRWSSWWHASKPVGDPDIIGQPPGPPMGVTINGISTGTTTGTGVPSSTAGSKISLKGDVTPSVEEDTINVEPRGLLICPGYRPLFPLPPPPPLLPSSSTVAAKRASSATSSSASSPIALQAPSNLLAATASPQSLSSSTQQSSLVATSSVGTAVTAASLSITVPQLIRRVPDWIMGAPLFPPSPATAAVVPPATKARGRKNGGKKRDTRQPSSAAAILLHATTPALPPNNNDNDGSDSDSDDDDDASVEEKPLPPPVPPMWKTVRRIVIVGLHGWSLLNGAFGDHPSKMSQKLCRHMTHAVRAFLTTHDIDPTTVEITCIPLARHGKIEARVQYYLNQQLPPFAHSLRTADLVLFVAHSQGVLVANLLLERLIVSQRWLDPDTQHISVLSMAGPQHGPFPDLFSDQQSATKELFGLSHAWLDIPRKFMTAITFLLSHGVKMCCIGSCMDQVVPLFSATVMGISSHPNLLRAFYIDNLFPLTSGAPTSATSTASSPTNDSITVDANATATLLPPLMSASSDMPTANGRSNISSGNGSAVTSQPAAPMTGTAPIGGRPRSSSMGPPPVPVTPGRSGTTTTGSSRATGGTRSGAAPVVPSGIPTPSRSRAAGGGTRATVMASPARPMPMARTGNGITSVGVAATSPSPSPAPSLSSSLNDNNNNASPAAPVTTSSVSSKMSDTKLSPPSSSSLSSPPVHIPPIVPPSLSSSPSLPTSSVVAPSVSRATSSLHDNDIDDEETKNGIAASLLSSHIGDKPSLLPSLSVPPLIAAARARAAYNTSLQSARNDFMIVLLDTIFQLQLADHDANGSTELLIHLSSYIRGRLLDRNGGAHSAIHSSLDCYQLGTEWAFSGAAHGNVPVTVNHQSMVVLAPLLSESFASSSLTKYLIEVRMSSLMMAAARHSELNDQMLRLRSCFTRWVPPARLKPFRDAIEPIITRRSRL